MVRNVGSSQVHYVSVCVCVCVCVLVHAVCVCVCVLVHTVCMYVFAGIVHLWSDREAPVLNPYAQPSIFPDEVQAMIVSSPLPAYHTPPPYAG